MYVNHMKSFDILSWIFCIDDRLIGVNGFYVDNKPHNEVVQLIKKGGASSWLLVVDRQTDEHFYSKLKRKPTFADAEYGQKGLHLFSLILSFCSFSRSYKSNTLEISSWQRIVSR